MAEYFILIGKQVLLLLLMMCVGYFCGKKKLFGEGTVRDLNRFVALFVISMTAIAGMQLPYSHQRLKEFGLGLLIAIGMYLLDFILAWFLFRRQDAKRRGLYSVGSSMTNAGFIGYPIMTAMIGSEGVFYGMPYGLYLNFFAWTIGAACISGDKRNVSLKKVFTNVTVIACVVAFLLFALRIRLPGLSMDFMNYFVNMNMPIPMIITGYYLSRTNLKAVVCRKSTWAFAFVRLVFLPLVGMGLLYLLGLRGNMFIAAAVANAVPPAAYLVILSTHFNNHTQEASELSSFTTLLSVVTLPLILSLAAMLA